MSRTSGHVVKASSPEYVIDHPTELCCGAACDTAKRDAELKLIGVREYLRLLKRTTPLTDEQVYVLDAVASEYNMELHPL